MIVINTTHFKTIKDFIKFVLSFKNEKDLSVYFDQEHFTVCDMCTMSNKEPFQKFTLWTIAANALLFKRNNLLCKELQDITEF